MIKLPFAQVIDGKEILTSAGIYVLLSRRNVLYVERAQNIRAALVDHLRRARTRVRLTGIHAAIYHSRSGYRAWRVAAFTLEELGDLHGRRFASLLHAERWLTVLLEPKKNDAHPEPHPAPYVPLDYALQMFKAGDHGEMRAAIRRGRAAHRRRTRAMAKRAVAATLTLPNDHTAKRTLLTVLYFQ